MPRWQRPWPGVHRDAHCQAALLLPLPTLLPFLLLRPPVSVPLLPLLHVQTRPLLLTLLLPVPTPPLLLLLPVSPLLLLLLPVSPLMLLQLPLLLLPAPTSRLLRLLLLRASWQLSCVGSGVPLPVLLST